MAQDYNNHFPIKTATACNSKWTWSTIWLNKGETSSCHRVIDHTFDIENFNFHNINYVNYLDCNSKILV